MTLVLGVAAGLYMADSRADQARTDAAAQEEAARAALVANVVAWSKQNAQDRAEQAAIEAAEKARKKAEEQAEAARKRAAEQASRQNRPSTPPSYGPIPESCNEYSGNRAIGCALLLEAGFGLNQMTCLERLWTKESGWNHKASNPSSGAYGIPQALPGNKMASFGDDWRTNPATQIKWGLSYIKNRYDTPCGAWEFFQNNNWY